jgi:AraC family transcriptional regulator, regulatory protein of adaptative response / methylphosphotriester-DNA alkyltransferase methyltransferase
MTTNHPAKCPTLENTLENGVEPASAPQPLTEDAMWQAVAACDPAFDGQFFYAVSTTGVYCRPSCRSKHPRREHVRYFLTGEAARAAGFRPCKRCRSDLAAYRPMLDMAARIRDMLQRDYTARLALADGLKGLGMSRRRMTELYKAVYGETPGAYLAALRLAEAKRRLTDTDEPLTDIAFAVGFDSLSGFYRFFQTYGGASPAAYRRLHGRQCAQIADKARGKATPYSSHLVATLYSNAVVRRCIATLYCNAL